MKLARITSTVPYAAKLGTAFAIVKSDVGGNIDRLHTRMQQNTSIYRDDMYRIVLDEEEQGVCMDSTSCTKGLLWLMRYACGTRARRISSSCRCVYIY